MTTTAVALSTSLSANAITTAPAGLAATLSTTALAGTTVATATTATTAKVIAMTTLQKTIVAATLTIVAGAGIYEARQASNMHAQVQTLLQENAPLTEEIRRLQRERDDATNGLARLQNEVERLNGNTAELLRLRAEIARLRSDSEKSAQLSTAESDRSDPTETAAKAWLARVNFLKQQLKLMPDKRIPEMQLLTDLDWLRITDDVNYNTETDVRRALYHLREQAKNNFAPKVAKALRGYIAANNNQLPADFSQLKPYFDFPVDDAMLARYRMLQTGDASILEREDRMVVIENAPPVDNEFDTVFQVGLNSRRSEGIGKINNTTMGAWQVGGWRYEPGLDRRAGK